MSDQQLVITPGTTQIYTTFIRASAERIWQALTDSSDTSRYFFGCEIRSDFAPGSNIVYGDPDKPAASGVVEISEPPRRLVMSWRSHWCGDFDAEPASRVSWEIMPLGDVCKLTLVHDQLEHSPQTAEAVAGGWSLVLSGLKTLIETGEALPSPQPEEAIS